MSKLDNHIYLIICEITYELFKKSKHITYINYCRLIKAGIISEDLGNNQKRDILILMKILYKIFDFDHKTSGEYVNKFFIEDKFEKLEVVVITTLEAFPNIDKLINISN